MKKCSNCKIGRKSLQIEDDSIVCPYIESCINNNFCFYDPVKEKYLSVLLKRIFHKEKRL